MKEAALPPHRQTQDTKCNDGDLVARGARQRRSTIRHTCSDRRCQHRIFFAQADMINRENNEKEREKKLRDALGLFTNPEEGRE